LRDVRALPLLVLGLALVLLTAQVPEALARIRTLIKRITAPKTQGLFDQLYAHAPWSSKTFQP
jgi:predicted PurR-regulated permease PerM